MMGSNRRRGETRQARPCQRWALNRPFSPLFLGEACTSAVVRALWGLKTEVVALRQPQSCLVSLSSVVEPKCPVTAWDGPVVINSGR